MDATNVDAARFFSLIDKAPGEKLTVSFVPVLAGVPASLVKSPAPPGSESSTSLPGRNPAGEDALLQVKPIRDVSKLSLSISNTKGVNAARGDHLRDRRPRPEVTPMMRQNAGTTNPTLLNRLCDWRDHEAWVDFVTRYDPLIRLACRQYRLSAENADELCQRVWIDLARRMRTFRYDPGKTFRGWLRRLCQSRAIDLLRKQNADAVLSLEDQPLESLLQEALCRLRGRRSRRSGTTASAPPG